MTNFFVDISNSATTTGSGASSSPFTWSQFLSHYSNNTNDYGDRSYHLKGYRIETSLSINLIQYDINTIIIDNWDSTPWKLYCSNSIEFNSGYNDLIIYNGFIESSSFILFNVKTQNKLLIIDNCWIKSEYTNSASFGINLKDFSTCTITNSTLSTITGSSGLLIDNFNYLENETNIINTIFDVHKLSKSYDSTDTYAVFNNSVFATTSSASLSATIPSNFYYVSITVTDCQDSWTTSPVFLSGVSALDSSNIDYLGSYFNDISIKGNRVYNTISDDFYYGKRDGVGALYFPTYDIDYSASPKSGLAPFDCTFIVSSAGISADSSNVSYNFGTGVTSSDGGNLSSTYTYAIPGYYTSYVTSTLKNEWYTISSSGTVISALDNSIAATYHVYDYSTSAVITSAYTFQDIFLSGYVTLGTLSQYIWDLGNNISATIVDDEITQYNYYYPTSGSYSIELSAYNITGQCTVFSKSFSVLNRIVDTYYVNIDESYDISASNTGTESDPLNFDEFLSYINVDGLGKKDDIFLLKGMRTIEKTGSDSVPFTPIITDSDKNFTINGWNLSAYGPWILAIEDYSTSRNSILNFTGSTLKNGIIYNKTYSIFEDIDNGGKIYITNAYDMYIVNQGEGSEFIISPNTSAVNIYGCTINCENGLKDQSLGSNYTLNLVDSVIVNLYNYDPYQYFTDCSLYLYSCQTNSESTTVSGFSISGTSDCIYSWTIPENYPYTKDNVGYDNDLEYLMNNRYIIAPFLGVSAIGYGSPDYVGYETDLFGNLRKDYIQ